MCSVELIRQKEMIEPKVENILFYVPYDALCQSRAFLEQYQTSRVGEDSKLITAAGPTRIAGIKADEFRDFLKLLIRV